MPVPHKHIREMSFPRTHIRIIRSSKTSRPLTTNSSSFSSLFLHLYIFFLLLLTLLNILAHTIIYHIAGIIYRALNILIPRITTYVTWTSASRKASQWFRHSHILADLIQICLCDVFIIFNPPCGHVEAALRVFRYEFLYDLAVFCIVGQADLCKIRLPNEAVTGEMTILLASMRSCYFL